jgi:aminopeptidase
VSSVPDPRIDAYARLLVGRCLGVEPGWQVLVKSRPAARPLVQAVAREIAGRGAYALLRIGFGPYDSDLEWAKEAPPELVETPSAVDRFAYETVDAWINIRAPESAHEGADLPTERERLLLKGVRPFTARRLSFAIPWVGCQFPTASLAQDAGMSLAEYEDFLYGACLRDWDAEAARMERYKERFDAASEVRLIGEQTDLRLGLQGREGMVDDGHLNMPGGEFFFSPVEDTAAGVVEFSEFPAVEHGHEALGVRLRFDGGRVVDASAQTGEEYLLATLDADPGARELGVGCNPGITRHTKNTLFDEKIDGTVHLAVGAGFPHLGGTNESVVHWDMVKDLRRPGTCIELDGVAVQRDGRWTI